MLNRFKKLWYIFTANSSGIQKIRNEEFVKAGGKLGRNFHGNGSFPFSEPYLLEIGDDVTIASGTHWVLHDNSVIKLGIDATDYYGKIKIGNNCFIGTNVTLLPGVVLGDNTIVGASSVVTKSFPDGNVVLAGNPARIICTVEQFREKKGQYVLIWTSWGVTGRRKFFKTCQMKCLNISRQGVFENEM